jgi:hypothetical protein
MPDSHFHPAKARFRRFRGGQKGHGQMHSSPGFLNKWRRPFLQDFGGQADFRHLGLFLPPKGIARHAGRY